MEPLANSAEQPKRSTPWGAIIGLVLILSVVVAGAFYSFTKRYQPAQPAQQTGQQ